MTILLPGSKVASEIHRDFSQVRLPPPRIMSNSTSTVDGHPLKN